MTGEIEEENSVFLFGSGPLTCLFSCFLRLAVLSPCRVLFQNNSLWAYFVNHHCKHAAAEWAAELLAVIHGER